mmetsp:Transcript_114/g.202  ORF Transcript_114/g.202 Transcript_114/m.202 type:complete len:427 (+) Transcript_114:10-1290(+)
MASGDVTSRVVEELKRFRDWKQNLIQEIDLSRVGNDASSPSSSSSSSSSLLSQEYAARLPGWLPGRARRFVNNTTSFARKIYDFSLIPSTPEDEKEKIVGVHQGGEVEVSKVMRVNQLDAQTLDDDLHQLLWVGLERIARHGGQGLLLQWRAEAKALLKFTIFWNTIWAQKSTPGMELQNLILIGLGKRRPRFVPGAPRLRLLTYRQRVLYGVLTIFAPWLLTRSKDYMSDRQWIGFQRGSIRRVIYELVNALELAWDAASIVHILVFLAGGTYRNLVERLLRIRVGYVNPRAHRALSFEFMNQYLVWRTVARFLLFAIPLVDFGLVFRSIVSMVGWKKGWWKKGGPQDEGEDDDDAVKGRGKCALCGLSPIVVPMRATPCTHVFCYTCLRSLRMESPNPVCPRCSKKIVGEQRVIYHVPNESKRK